MDFSSEDAAALKLLVEKYGKEVIQATLQKEDVVDVCCVDCEDVVCKFNEEPPHKDDRDEALCDECYNSRIVEEGCLEYLVYLTPTDDDDVKDSKPEHMACPQRITEKQEIIEWIENNEGCSIRDIKRLVVL